MPGLRADRVIASAIIVGLYLLTALLLAQAWSPGRGDTSILVWEPRGMFAGVTGGPGNAGVVLYYGKSALILRPEGASTIPGLRPFTACGNETTTVVAGALEGWKAVLVIDGNLTIRSVYRFRVAAFPQACTVNRHGIAVLLEDPVQRDYVLAVRGRDALLVGLPRDAPRPRHAEILGNGSLLVTGDGYAFVASLSDDGQLTARVTLFFHEEGRPIILGGYGDQGGLTLYGYLQREGEDRGKTGLLYQGGEWLLVEKPERSTVVHAAFEPYPGVTRLVLEVVGRETDIVDIRGDRVTYVSRLMHLATYILHNAGRGEDYVWIHGDLKVKRGDEEERVRVVDIIRSNNRFALGKNASMVSAVLHKTDPPALKPIDMSVKRSEWNLGSTPIEPEKGDLTVREATDVEARYELLGVVVERDIILCSLLAVLSLYFIPVLLAVDRSLAEALGHQLNKPAQEESV